MMLAILARRLVVSPAPRYFTVDTVLDTFNRTVTNLSLYSMHGLQSATLTTKMFAAPSEILVDSCARALISE